MMQNNARRIFIDNLKRIMSQKNIKQTDIAYKTGFPLSTISSWYNGQSYPRVDKMQKLADVLDVSMKELTDENASENIPEHFETVTDAMEFILRVPVVANNCGYDLDTMSDEEVIEMAEDLSEMLQIMARKHRKK